MEIDDPPQPDAHSKQQGEAIAVLGRLQAACASDSHASLLAAHMSLSCTGRLRSASVAGVVVEIPNPPQGDKTLLGTTAAVTFPLGGGVAGFVTDVTDVKVAADGGLLVTLRLPQQLRFDDRRSAVRISVPRGTLSVAVIGEGAREPVHAVDISLQGILLDFEVGQASALAIGRSVTLSLALAGAELVVEAEVCRRDGRRFGLRFTSPDGPPAGMPKIMYELQEARRPTR